MLAGALALAVTSLSVSLTLIPDAYAYQPVSPSDTAVARTVAPDDPMVRVHPNLVTTLKAWTVQDGQTLSSIAGARYGNQNAWTVIYWANHSHIKWADQIQVGQVLSLPVWNDPLPAAPRFTSPPPPPPPVVVPRVHRAGSSVAYSSTYHRSTTRTYHRAYTSGTYHGSGSMERCIISRESGGNSQVMNGSSHYGLYQFSASTWVASGGSAGSFGHASVAEQQRVFRTAVAARGYSDWTPYDGC
jgi:hypothetical protein